MIRDIDLQAWEQLASRANVQITVPAGYNSMLEEDARRMIRTQLTRDAVPQLISAYRKTQEQNLDLAGSIRLAARAVVGLQGTLDALGIPWRHQCVCGEYVSAPDPRCEDGTLCTACADELAAASDQL